MRVRSPSSLPPEPPEDLLCRGHGGGLSCVKQECAFIGVAPEAMLRGVALLGTAFSEAPAYADSRQEDLGGCETLLLNPLGKREVGQQF